jgi:hypothetical protein
MERAVVDGMSLEERGESYTVKERIADLIQIRNICAKDDYPGGIPAGIMEKEHPGDNRNSGGIYEMLGQHIKKHCWCSLNGFLPNQGIFVWSHLDHLLHCLRGLTTGCYV